MKEKRFPEQNLPGDVQLKADNMNTREADIPAFEALPLCADRTAVLDVFAREMYGPIPPRCEMILQTKNEAEVFGGLGIRREIDIICRNRGIERTLHMLLYLPAKTMGKVPCFFGLNFPGNIATTADTGATFYPFRCYTADSAWYADRRAGAGEFGSKRDRWEFEKVLKAGFASATICYFDCFSDHPDGYDESIMPLFCDRELWGSPQRPTGAVSAWAWGIQRAVDVLSQQPEIAADRIVVHGLSRLGKTALWAGANDERIALTVSFCSGTCGAKMTRRYFGESLEWLLHWRPYWFVPSLAQYVKKDTVIPFDQQQLMAAIAPRGLYVASASLDDYADPKGEFLAAKAASEAWEDDPLKGCDFPAVKCGTGNGNVRYFLREGEHNCTPENWDDLIRFTAKFFQMEQL